MRDIESSAKIRVRQRSGVFDHRAAINHRIVFQGRAARYHCGSPYARARDDKRRAQNASALVHLGSAAKPNSRLHLLTFGLQLNTLHEPFDCKLPQMVGRTKAIYIAGEGIEVAGVTELPQLMPDHERGFVPPRRA